MVFLLFRRRGLSLEMFLAAESDGSRLFRSLMNKIQTIIYKIECSLLVLVDRLKIKGVETSHWLNRDLTNDMVFHLENVIAFLKSKLRFHASRLSRELRCVKSLLQAFVVR